MSDNTPMIDQYLEIKAKHQDSILFFRLGDFYEMFFEDAQIVAKELGLTLTSRQKGGGQKAAMAGVPYHSADSYIADLIAKGYSVAICEQLEDPQQAKGIVKRDVVRIVTPGTIIEADILKEGENNYLTVAVSIEQGFGLVSCDISCGEILTTEFPANDISHLIDEIARIKPQEIYFSKKLLSQKEIEELLTLIDISAVHSIDQQFSYHKARNFLLENLAVNSLEGFELEEKQGAVIALAELAKRLIATQKKSLDYINTIRYYQAKDFMLLDDHTRRNLELNKALSSQNKQRGSITALLDQTKTAMGKRLLKKWINQPLLNKDEINKRLDFAEELINADPLRSEIRTALQEIYDLERLIGRVGFGNANGRDLVALKNSLSLFPQLGSLVKQIQCFNYLLENQPFDDCQDIFSQLDQALAAEPPLLITEGNLIKPGFNDDLDQLRKQVEEGRAWIANLENEERKRTNIKNLKVRYNKVFGYYIEITKSYLDLAPPEYIRKQTLSNCERYFTPELKDKENLILGAEEKINDLEYQIFIKLRADLNKQRLRIIKMANLVAKLDCLLSLSIVAIKNNYTRPKISYNGKIVIEEGRHPVVEDFLPLGDFVPNNTNLNQKKDRFHLITGPNMSGKSTYLRQVALIVLFAQIGSFVPAQKAEIGIVDRIFTRVGATDDLSGGKSTFMVEMNEVAQILNGATENSLVLLDEVGRGTSTYDGLSIAWAVSEYLNNPKRIGARTLFATHYHELTTLASKKPGIKNYNVAVEKKGTDITFLHTIVEGPTDESYGIYVARLAGLPPEVLYRAAEILEKMEKKNETVKPPPQQISLFPAFNETAYQKFISEIEKLDINNLTPIEALNLLSALQKKSYNLLGGTTFE